MAKARRPVSVESILFRRLRRSWQAGGCAFRSMPAQGAQKPLVYMNFRVYSSGIQEDTRRHWFNEMERLAMQEASVSIALSRLDRQSLLSICGVQAKKIEILLPPLRSDMQELAQNSTDELSNFLPKQVPRVMHASATRRSLVTCVARLSREKHVRRFVRFVEHSKHALEKLGLIPLLAGASADDEYAAAVKEELSLAFPTAIILDDFLSPRSLAAVFSRTALNFHPCAYDAYGMTVIEAAACAAPSVLAGESVGASALLGSHCLYVDMPSDENEIPSASVQAILALLQSSELEKLGDSAKRKALEWNEIAYGSELLRMILQLL
mmetsp:Transcript_34999/g.65184  ORF Transcript_34999/g.65184 Transcript_34999/m.65184 type:complete len:324 (+) Transcript_34999:331-1302(+)